MEVREPTYLFSKEVDDLIQETIECVRQKHTLDKNLHIVWTWSNKMTRTAGYAWKNKRKVRFSADLFKRDKVSGRRNTIVHEICHILSWEVYGNKIKPHGNEWKYLMRLCGEEPLRTHNIKVKPKHPRYPTYCMCPKPHMLVKQMINRMKRGTAYTCTTCKEVLTLHKDFYI